MPSFSACLPSMQSGQTRLPFQDAESVGGSMLMASYFAAARLW